MIPVSGRTRQLTSVLCVENHSNEMKNYSVAKLCSSSFAFCIAHSLNQFPLTMNNPRFLPHFTFSVLSALARTCVTLSFIAVAMVAPSPTATSKSGCRSGLSSFDGVMPLGKMTHPFRRSKEDAGSVSYTHLRAHET